MSASAGASPGPDGRPGAWGPLALLLAVTLVVWAPALGAAFVWDDHDLILGNPIVREGRLGDVFGDLWERPPRAHPRTGAR